MVLLVWPVEKYDATHFSFDSKESLKSKHWWNWPEPGPRAAWQSFQKCRLLRLYPAPSWTLREGDVVQTRLDQDYVRHNINSCRLIAFSKLSLSANCSPRSREWLEHPQMLQALIWRVGGGFVVMQLTCLQELMWDMKNAFTVISVGNIHCYLIDVCLMETWLRHV